MLKKYNDFDLNGSQIGKFIIDKNLIKELKNIDSNIQAEYDGFIKELFERYSNIIEDKVAEYIPGGYKIGNVNTYTFLFDNNAKTISSNSAVNEDENSDVLEKISDYQTPMDILNINFPLISSNIDGKK